MRWKESIGILSGALLICWTGSAHAQVGATATALSDDSIRVNFSGFSAAPICFNGPQVTRYRNTGSGFFNDGTDSRPLGDTSETYGGLGGGSYYFRVTGCVLNNSDEPEFESATSNTVTIAGLQVPTPDAPTSVSATATDDVATVSWDNVNGATYYNTGVRSQPLDGWVDGSTGTWSNWADSNAGDVLSRDYPGLSPSAYQFRVSACNSTGCSTPVQSAAVIIEAPQFDGGDEYFMPNAKIRAIWTAPEGCLVLFEDLPDACETKFSNAHALIQFENPNHEKMYSQVFVANAMGKQIDVWFDDNGDCSSLDTLMTIGKMEIKDSVAARLVNDND